MILEYLDRWECYIPHLGIGQEDQQFVAPNQDPIFCQDGKSHCEEQDRYVETQIGENHRYDKWYFKIVASDDSNTRSSHIGR